MKKIIVQLLKIAFVVFASYTIVATSKVTNTGEILKTYTVSSNCSNAIVNNETMTSSNYGTISSPINRTYLDYGLPLASIRFGAEPTISATLNGVTRSCEYFATTNITSGKIDVQYVCTDNGVASCNVLFTAM